MSEPLAVIQSPALPQWRPRVAMFLFVVALISPGIALLILAGDLPQDTRLAVGGLLLFGVPMALMLAVVALMGQRAYRFIMRGVAAGDPAAEVVGLARYRTGLVLLLVAMLVSWLEPLVSPHFPAIEARRVLIGTLADALVLVALFVLGGAFWDKFHALFVHDARVVQDGPMAPPTAELVEVGVRFYVGVAILIAAFGAWLLVPAASAAGWSTKQVASLTGAIFIANKIGVLTAIAVMGKAGFNHIKRLVGGAVSKLAPSQQVSRDRYRLGLLLLLVPFLMTWVAPYAPAIFGNISVYGFLESRALEALLLVGLFLLGGEFWDKLAALFKYRSKVQFGTP